jgi:murein DD-endopeptidase MepM/ murein hydrolase activator NlpD
MSDLPLIDTLRSSRTGTDDIRAGDGPEQLRALAAQFESLLVSQMLQQMRQSMFDESDTSSGFNSGPLADSLFAELSVALSRAGGFGLGQSLMEPLERAAGTTGAPTPSEATVAAAPAAALARAVRTSEFGWRRDPVSGDVRFHKGVDLAMPVGQDVPVARGGSVVSAGALSGYGQTVVVAHGDGTSTRYAHLSEILVQPGETVAAGQTIAKSGATGRVTGPHLHFEVLRDGIPVDPDGW